MIARIIAFVVPLGFDTLAVAIAIGLRGIEPWRPALIFTAFEVVVPIVGVLAGRFAGERFAAAAGIIGAVILVVIGIHAFREAWEEQDESSGFSFASVRGALLAGVAISMDELAVGFPLGTLRLPIGPLLVAIGLQTFFVTSSGILLGRRISTTLGRNASRFSAMAAGIAFVALGLWLLSETLFHL